MGKFEKHYCDLPSGSTSEARAKLLSIIMVAIPEG